MINFMVEIQKRKDFDDIIIQSQWFDSEEQAQNWFDSLEWFDKDTLTATIMSCEFDENCDMVGDINVEKWIVE